MKTFYCSGCGNRVEVGNFVTEVYCSNKKCSFGPNALMDEVKGRVNLDKKVYVDKVGVGKCLK